MKNRDKYIIKSNEFDMLIKLQAAYQSGMCFCVIEALTAKEYPCPKDKQWTPDICKECIENWLNKEG